MFVRVFERTTYLEQGAQLRCPIVVLLDPSSIPRGNLLVSRINIPRPSAFEVIHPGIPRRGSRRLNLNFDQAHIRERERECFRPNSSHFSRIYRANVTISRKGRGKLILTA